MAPTKPDRHPGTGASAGQLHFGRGRGASRPNSERVRSFRAVSEKGNQRRPPPKPTSTPLHRATLELGPKFRRERKSSFGSLNVVRGCSSPPCPESCGGTTRLLKWAQRSSDPSLRLRRAGARVWAPTQPSSHLARSPPSPACRLLAHHCWGSLPHLLACSALRVVTHLGFQVS